MFTGIIEAVGEIKDVSVGISNRIFHIESEITSQLSVDESISHNGICLTIEEVDGNRYRVTAIAETLKKTNAGLWKPGDLINLERSMRLSDRLDGHIVQGHVDGTGVCIKKRDREGSVEFTFQFDESFAPLVIEKGSVCVNGVSLTAFNVTNTTFAVAIIPFTFSHTNFKKIKEDDVVNIEYDILGKYIARLTSIRSIYSTVDSSKK
ncbi:MAG: riboflavin synthase [Ginsengibacter sp.]